jgi:hypothetical protein
MTYIYWETVSYFVFRKSSKYSTYGNIGEMDKKGDTPRLFFPSEMGEKVLVDDHQDLFLL